MFTYLFIEFRLKLWIISRDMKDRVLNSYTPTKRIPFYIAVRGNWRDRHLYGLDLEYKSLRLTRMCNALQHSANGILCCTMIVALFEDFIRWSILFSTWKFLRVVVVGSRICDSTFGNNLVCSFVGAVVT